VKKLASLFQLIPLVFGEIKYKIEFKITIFFATTLKHRYVLVIFDQDLDLDLHFKKSMDPELNL